MCVSQHTTENYTLLSRVRNKPYDVFGCWLNETHLISGNLHWIGNMTSCSVLWLNKAFQVSQSKSFFPPKVKEVLHGPHEGPTEGISQLVLCHGIILLNNIFLYRQDVESENVNVVKRLFKIQNINASTIRTVMVAHCRRHDNPDLLLDYEAQSQARRQKGQQQHHHQPLLFDLGTSGSEDEDEEVEGDELQREARCHGLPAGRLPQPTISGLEHVMQVREL